MEAPSLYWSRSLQGIQSHLPGRPPCRCRRLGLRRRSQMQAKASALRKDDEDADHQGDFQRRRMDDTRIRLPEMMDADIAVPHETWKNIEWDNEYCHTFFKSGYCEILGLLQFDPPLRGRRRAIAIGLTVTVTLNAPTLALVLLMYLMDAAKDVVLRVKRLQDDE